MKKKLALLLAGSLLAIATAASAENREGAFSVSPVVGGYSFDSRQHLETSLVYGGRLGYNFTKAFGIEALFDYAKTEKQANGNREMYRYGGELLYHFFPEKTFVPYVAAGFAGQQFGSERARGAFDYGVGAKYFISDNFALRTDVRHILYRNGSASDWTLNNIEYTVGAYIPFGGVSARPVPVVAPVVAPKVEEPTSRLTATPSYITKGESSTLDWSSRNTDACDIKPTVGVARTEGSTVVTPAETTTYTLTCNGAGGTTTSNATVAVGALPVSANLVANPATINRGDSSTLSWTSKNAKNCNIDQVGSVDTKGKVAVTPADTTTYKLVCDGSTSYAKVTVNEVKPMNLCEPTVLDVKFDFNKSDIKPQYHDDLDRAGKFLTEHPDAKVGYIDGHTDNVGSKAYNQKLSSRRAASVKNYLVKNFKIDGKRITTRGFGFSKPVATNKTAAGRQQNRRIEAAFACPDNAAKADKK